MSECELPAFYSHAEPVAKKQHRCCECSAPILKGEKHFKCTGKWDGGLQTFRQHLVCMEACMMIRDEFNDGECIGFGDLVEAFGDRKGDCDKKHPTMKKMRHLMAVIKVRERNS